MNYYPHHIGDFNQATRHLNRVERSIYRDLIELYYDKESPIFNDIELICKKAIANTEEECIAVQCILTEFFILKGDYYHHFRCDIEIEKYQAKVGAARANGAKGGRPKNPDKTQSVNLANPDKTESKANQNQNQNHKPEPIKKKGVKRFTPPTFQELCDYIKSKNYNVSPNRFMDYYKSNGWKVGKNKMVSWKHTVSSWNTRNEDKQNGNEKNRKLSAAERASKQVRDFDEHLRQKQADNSEGVATDGNMLRPSLD